MVSRTATIRNEYGIHCRPSALIVQKANDFVADITVRTAANDEADAKVVLALITLGISCGETVTVTVRGPDEEEACRVIAELLETDFAFAPG